MFADCELDDGSRFLELRGLGWTIVEARSEDASLIFATPLFSADLLNWATTVMCSCVASFAKFLLRCAAQEEPRRGRSAHARAIKIGLSGDQFLGNGLISFYAKCGLITDAAQCLEDMDERDSASWNCVINSLARLGGSHSVAAIKLFHSMRVHGGDTIPNSFTFAGIFTAAAQAAEPAAGIEAHSLSIKLMGVGDVFVGSSLVNMYCKLGMLYDARKVFDRMPERNSISWAAMLAGYASQKQGGEAFSLFKLMQEEDKCPPNEFVITSLLSAVSQLELASGNMGRQIHSLVTKNGLVPFVSVRNSLLTMYAKCELMHDAENIFRFSDGLNSISWSALITGLAQNGNSAKALRLFSQMHTSGFKPSEFTFVSSLNACSDEADLVGGSQLHGYLLKLGFESQVYTKSALVDMYAKCGNVKDARKGFDQIHEADVVLWTTMIGGYIQNGENKEALCLYKIMQEKEMQPNDLTMVNILRVCSLLPSLDLGRQVHAYVHKSGFGLEIPLGSSLVTFYAKCGKVEESYDIFWAMPKRDVVAWNSVISGFSHNGQGDVALELFHAMIEDGAKPDHVSFVNVLSACSHMGLVERGWGYLRSMSVDHGLSPTAEHYACMVDILGRRGKLEDARDLIESVQVNEVEHMWRILLGASRNYQNYMIGAHAGEKLMELGSRDSSAYVLLSGIYSASGRWRDVERVRKRMRLLGVGKQAGCSWMEFKNKVHLFVVGDDQHPQIEEIKVEARRLARHMKDDEDILQSVGPLLLSVKELIDEVKYDYSEDYL